MTRSPQEYTERYVQQTVRTVQEPYLAEGITTLVEVFSKARAAGKTLIFSETGAVRPPAAIWPMTWPN